jgi:hypothetical protein
LIHHALSDFCAEGSQLPKSFHKLWSILTQTISDPKAGEVICILDALDECEASERYEIITALNTFFGSSQKNTSKLKFLVTSRPYFDIETRFKRLTRDIPTIRLQGEKESTAISREIDIVIKERVKELGVDLDLDGPEQSTLERELLGMEHRTYLWLKLILEVIRDEIGPTSKRLKQITGSLPGMVDQAYEAILLKSKDPKRARKLLHIIVAATRPLTLKEMNIALAIDDHHRSYEDLDLKNEARFESDLRNICGLFVSVIDQKIYLLHQTAKEFLVTKSQAPPSGWKQSINPVESELLMARICITYLMFTVFEDGIINDTHTEMNDANYGYLDYAASFWATHYTKVQSKSTETVLQLVLTLCDTRSRRFQIWFEVYWNMAHQGESTPQLSSMMVASYFGHRDVVELLLEAKANVESKDTTYGRTPLAWAAWNGHEGVVELLLEAKANIESEDTEYGQTTLAWAARNGHKGVVKLLLEA